MIQAASKSAIYDNCQLENPQGELIGRISLKKLNWYLDTGIAVQMYVLWFSFSVCRVILLPCLS